MCGMCTPPAALGLQCIYSVRSVSSGMQQGASKPFALTFSCLQSHKARIVSMQFLEPGACMCCWFEDAHSPCLARILEKWESFSQKDFRCTHTQLHHVLYNRWGLYGLGLQVGPVWSRLSRTALRFCNRGRLPPACRWPRAFCGPLIHCSVISWEFLRCLKELHLRHLWK